MPVEGPLFSPSPQPLCPGGLDPRDLKTALFCISFLRKGEVLAYVGRIHNLKDPKDLLYKSLCTGELNAIREHNCFLRSPFYAKGMSLGYVGLN